MITLVELSDNPITPRDDHEVLFEFSFLRCYITNSFTRCTIKNIGTTSIMQDAII